MEKDHVIVLTTISADADGHALASTLVNERLAACVNVLAEMQSIYRWQGKVESAAERQLLIKTRLPLVDALEKRIKQLHPYDLPEFIVVPIVGGSARYLAWITENTSEAG